MSIKRERMRMYVMTFDPNNSRVGDDILCLYGPFKDRTEAAEFGRKWQEANSDSPCWNTIMIPDDHIARNVMVVPVFDPTQISFITCGGKQ